MMLVHYDELFDVGCLKKKLLNQDTFHISPVASIHMLVLPAKLYQMFQINSERHLLLFVMDLCKRLYRYISRVIANSWCAQDPLERNPDWLFFNRLLSSKYLNNALNMSFWKFFSKIGNIETGRQFFSAALPFL